MQLDASNSSYQKKGWYHSPLLRWAGTDEQRDQSRINEAGWGQVKWRRIKQVFTNEIHLYIIQHSICCVHDLLNPSELQPSALIHLTHQRFCVRIEMEHSDSMMMELIYTEWVDVNHHHFSSHNMSDTCHIHRFPVLNYYSERLCSLTSLNIWHSSVTEWDYSRCATAVNVSSTEHIVAAGFVCYHRLARSVNEDNSWAVTAEILFHLSLHAKFSHSVTFIQYYSHHSRYPSWLEICTRTIGQKPSQGEQLLLLPSHFTRFFSKCRCIPAKWRSNQLTYPHPVNRSHTETEVEETDEFIRDSMRYILPSLHDSHMYW